MDQIKPINDEDIFQCASTGYTFKRGHWHDKVCTLLQRNNDFIVIPAGTEEHKAFIANIEGEDR